MKHRIEKKSTAAQLRILLGLTLMLAVGVTGCAKKSALSGNVSWSKTGGVATTGKYRGVIVADLDNDTHLDIIGASSDPGKVAVWYGDGSGNMTMPQLIPSDAKIDIRYVAAADVNEDGRQDILGSIQRESSGIRVIINKPERKWEKGIEPTRLNNYEGIRVGDINQDGHVDVIAANATSEDEGGIQVWLGDGQGGWRIETGPTNTGRYMDVEVADFNKDNRPDIAGTAWGLGGGVRVWLGDGTGNWSAMPPAAFGNFNGLSLSDMNTDGNMDLLAGSYRDGVHIFLGDGTGRFEEMTGPVDAGSYWRPVPNDINGDGITDIIAGSVDGKGVRAWIRCDNDRWKEVEDIFPTLGNYYDFKSADLDHDGANELILASFGEGIKVISGKAWPYSQSLNVFPGSLAEGDAEAGGEVFENSVFTTKNGYEEYKVGPGDILEIALWEPEKITKEEVEIMPDGKMSFSFVEDLYVSGLTEKEVDELLTEELSAYIKQPRIVVNVSYFHSKWASILGPGRSHHDAGSGGWSGERGRRGGRFYLDGEMTLIELLSGAGVARDANLREILVTRANGRTLKLNVYKAMTLGDKTQDIVIDHGDAVYIPIISKEGNRIFVFGEVGQPGAYSFTGTTMPMLDAISAAGGPTVFALLDEAKIIRGDITKPEIISVNLAQLIETGDQSQNMPLMDGDLVYVPRTAIGDINLFVRRMAPIITLITAPVRAYDDIRDINGDNY